MIEEKTCDPFGFRCIGEWIFYKTRVRLMGILEENIRAFTEGHPVNIVNMQ